MDVDVNNMGSSAPWTSLVTVIVHETLSTTFYIMIFTVVSKTYLKYRKVFVWHPHPVLSLMTVSI